MNFLNLRNLKITKARLEDNLNSQPFIIDKNADCIHFKSYEVYIIYIALLFKNKYHLGHYRFICLNMYFLTLNLKKTYYD